MKEINFLSKAILTDDYSEVENLILDNSKNNLKIYQTNYLYGLLGVLEKAYPVTKIFLEEDNFRFFARNYIFSTPSKNSNIDEYGADFGLFLGGREELREIAYIEFISKLDWFWSRDFSEVKSVDLPDGVLELWGKVLNGDEINSVRIDGDNTQTIIKEIQGHEIILKAKCN